LIDSAYGLAGLVAIAARRDMQNNSLAICTKEKSLHRMVEAFSKYLP